MREEEDKTRRRMRVKIVMRQRDKRHKSAEADPSGEQPIENHIALELAVTLPCPGCK